MTALRAGAALQGSPNPMTALSNRPRCFLKPLQHVLQVNVRCLRSRPVFAISDSWVVPIGGLFFVFRTIPLQSEAAMNTLGVDWRAKSCSSQTEVVLPAVTAAKKARQSCFVAGTFF